jgi:hypothetical protein
VDGRAALEDHWSGDGPKAPPYYQQAGRRFADDAEALAPHSRAVAAILEELKRPGTLEIEGPRDVVWTSERRMELSYAVRPAASARIAPGTAVVWGEAEDATLLQLEPTAGGRTVLDVGGPTDGGDRPRPVRYDVRSPLLEAVEAAPPRKPDQRPTTFRVRGFFRGQDLEFATNVRLHPAPDSALIDDPKPPVGSVTVRAGDDILGRFGDNNAAVAVVLDASGSMWEDRDRVRIEDSKYAEATEAIRAILREIPRGTRVSLWVFGRAVGPLPQRRKPQDWETISRVLDPVAWDPGDRAQLEEVMRRIRPPDTIPFHGTPIVATMVRARKDLEGTAGFKTLVVLTDGGESEVKPADIPPALREAFRDTKIMINMVCFKANAVEQKEAQAQFKDVLENGLEVPGKFQLVNDTPALARQLSEFIARDLTYRVDKRQHVPVADRKGLPVGRANNWEVWHPGLDAGHFIVNVDAIPLSYWVDLKGGDRLLLRLVGSPGGGTVRFARDLYADEPAFRARPRVKQNGWLLAVLQNKLTADRALNMAVTLEKTFDPKETKFEQIEPREVWMELSRPGATGGIVGLRWGGREEYPAAAWELAVPDWPADADGEPDPARLRAWWDRDSKAPAAARLDRARGDFERPAPGPRPERSEGGDDQVVIESVSIEDRRVPVGPDGPVSCLVVRVRTRRAGPSGCARRGSAPRTSTPSTASTRGRAGTRASSGR